MLLFERKRKSKATTSSDMRLRRDLMEISLIRFQITTTRVSFPEGLTNVRLFHVLICPEEGLYQGGKFLFEFRVPPNYPFSAPSIRCLNKVFHPKICPRGGEVHLNILGRGWKPVLSINHLVFGLQLLFLEPNFDSLCEDWTLLLHQFDPSARRSMDRNRYFEDLVKRTLQGGFFFGAHWDKNTADAKTALTRGLRTKRKRSGQSCSRSPGKSESAPYVRYKREKKNHTCEHDGLPVRIADVSQTMQMDTLEHKDRDAQAQARDTPSSPHSREVGHIDHQGQLRSNRKRIRPINHSTLSCSFADVDTNQDFFHPRQHSRVLPNFRPSPNSKAKQIVEHREPFRDINNQDMQMESMEMDI